MISAIDPLRDIRLTTTLLRLLLSFFCGGLIGFERTCRNRPAGCSVHILVCLGGAVSSMTGVFLYLNEGLPGDISRIAAAVVAAIGSLGAGSIIVNRNRTVKGLTTAAGMWASGVIGLCIGAGYYEAGVITTVMVLFTQTVFFTLDHRIQHIPEFRITLHYDRKPALDQVMRYCKDKKVVVISLRVVGSSEPDSPDYVAIIQMRPLNRVNRSRLLAHIQDIPGVLEVEES